MTVRAAVEQFAGCDFDADLHEFGFNAGAPMRMVNAGWVWP